MIKLFFGLPGSGKTTLLVKFAYDEIRKKHSRYKFVYTNFECSVPGVININNNVIGHYDLTRGSDGSEGNALLLIDEATLFADSRDFKNFDYDRLLFFVLHRHFRTDVVLVTQYFDGVDLRIRRIIDRVYYLQKGLLTGFIYSFYYRIPFGILIPKKKDSEGSHLGEIVSGYYQPSFIQKTLFKKRVWRKKYYKYFDSFSKIDLPVLPADYKFKLEQQYYSPDEIKKKERNKKRDQTINLMDLV